MDVSKECDSASEETEELKSKSNMKNERPQSNFITLHFFKNYKMTICKPLATLNIGFLLWMAASSAGIVHFSVFLKTRGLTIHDIFLINTISSILTVMAVVVFAVIIDKIGRAKLLLILNLIVAGFLMFSLTLIPFIPDCDSEDLVLHSVNRSIRLIIGNNSCFEQGARIQTDLCKITCFDSIDNLCDGKTTCESIHEINGSNFTSFLFNDYSCVCPGYVILFSDTNEFKFLCRDSQNSSCGVYCPMVKIKDCLHDRNVMVNIYIIISCLVLMTFTSVYRFFDVTIMILMKEHNSNYGVVRFWGVIGTIVGFAMSGFVVQLATPVGEPTKYEASFHLYLVTCLLTAVIAYKIDVRNLKPATDLWQKSLSLMRNSETMIFALVILVNGTSWCFNIFYKNWYLADIGASSSVFSVVSTLSALYGLPFLFKSEWYLRKIGDTNMLVLALLSHALHSFGFSLLENTWLATLLEFTSVFSYHLLWVAAMHFCYRITPVGLFDTVNSTTGSLHFSVGRITGSFAGGVLMKYCGGRFTYKIFGALNILVAVPYIIYLYCRKKRVQKV